MFDSKSSIIKSVEFHGILQPLWGTCSYECICWKVTVGFHLHELFRETAWIMCIWTRLNGLRFSWHNSFLYFEEAPINYEIYVCEINVTSRTKPVSSLHAMSCRCWLNFVHTNHEYIEWVPKNYWRPNDWRRNVLAPRRIGDKTSALKHFGSKTSQSRGGDSDQGLKIASNHVEVIDVDGQLKNWHQSSEESEQTGKSSRK